MAPTSLHLGDAHVLRPLGRMGSRGRMGLELVLSQLVRLGLGALSPWRLGLGLVRPLRILSAGGASPSPLLRTSTFAFHPGSYGQ